MTTVAFPHAVAAPAETSTAIVQWRRRVLRVSALCEIAFGSLWLANGVRAGYPTAAPIVVLVGVVALVWSIRATRGTAPRPAGAEARALERRITIASALQIVVSVVVPVVLLAIGHSRLIMPVIIASVGVLFVWLHRLLRVPRLGRLGSALVVIPIGALIMLSGTTAVPVALLAAGTLMVGTGAAGIAQLRGRG